MTRRGALSLAASLVALWIAGYVPDSVRAFLLPLAAGLLTCGVAFLLFAGAERPCPACVEAGRLAALDVMSPEPLTPEPLTPDDEPDDRPLYVDDDPFEDVEDDEDDDPLFDVLADARDQPTPPPSAWFTSTDPWTTAPIPVVHDEP